jgi:myo-inositol 2-dehydrogenase/D-chiro-inositol 1-dehydrogenase
MADAPIRPDFKDRGLLDTATVTVRFDNGALATAEASFQAVYGYDVRGEVFGSAGMLTMGDVRRTHLTAYGPGGVTAECTTYDQDLFHDAYVAELADFTDSVRTGRTPAVTGQDARAALSIALAAIESITTGGPTRIDKLQAHDMPAPGAR